MHREFEWRMASLAGRPPLVEVTVSGYFTLAKLKGAYSAELNQRIAAVSGPLALLFLAEELTGIELPMSAAHAALLLPHMDRILAIATVSDKAFVRFGMASASLVLQRQFQSFVSRAAALDWLSSHEPRKAQHG